MDLLEKLLKTPSVSGSEAENTNVVEEYFKSININSYKDASGNVTGVKKGSGKKKIILDAHFDTIGLMVTKIIDGGFVKFTTVGGVDTRILPSMEVVIHGKNDVFGVIGTKPPHLLTDKTDAPYKISDLHIDTSCSKEELEKIIEIGDTITFSNEITKLKNNLVCAAGLDDKAGVYAILKVMENLKTTADVYAAASISEEIGMKGAKMLSAKEKFDLAIVVDVTFGKTPDINNNGIAEVGKGPVICFGTVLSREYNEKIIELAEKNNIPYQTEVEPDNPGTNAWIYNASGYSVPTVMLSIPERYMHTSGEVVSLDDINNLVKLLKLFLEAE